MLDLDAIGDTFSYVERFLNDIRLIALSSTFSYHDVSHACGDRASSDLVDLLLFGSIDRMFAAAGAGAAGKFPWQRREELYADLHREHDRRASPGELFNDLDSAVARGVRRVLVVAPTGAGKTTIAALILLRKIARRERAAAAGRVRRDGLRCHRIRSAR